MRRGSWDVQMSSQIQKFRDEPGYDVRELAQGLTLLRRLSYSNQLNYCTLHCMFSAIKQKFDQDTCNRRKAP